MQLEQFFVLHKDISNGAGRKRSIFRESRSKNCVIFVLFYGVSCQRSKETKKKTGSKNVYKPLKKLKYLL